MRDARKPAMVDNQDKQRPKSSVTTQRNKSTIGGDMPNYWHLYEQMLEDYHRKDAVKNKKV